MNDPGSTVAGREMARAILLAGAAVLASGIVPLGTPVFIVALLAAGEGWRRSAPASRAPYVLTAAAGILFVLMVVVVLFALTV